MVPEKNSGIIKIQEEKLSKIIASLEAKGYDPIEQLYAYALIGNLNYITRYGGAREKIKEVEIEIIKEYLKGVMNCE